MSRIVSIRIATGGPLSWGFSPADVWNTKSAVLEPETSLPLSSKGQRKVDAASPQSPTPGRRQISKWELFLLAVCLTSLVEAKSYQKSSEAELTLPGVFSSHYFFSQVRQAQRLPLPPASSGVSLQHLLTGSPCDTVKGPLVKCYYALPTLTQDHDKVSASHHVVDGV